MIEIPRPLLRQFRLAWKRSLPTGTGRTPVPWLFVETNKDQMTLQIQREDIALRWQVTTLQAPEKLCLPATVLQEAEGRAGNVSLGQAGDKVVARWTEQGVPRVIEYPTTDLKQLPPFPTLPTTWKDNPPALLKALDDAMQTAGAGSPRYATTHVQLRGSGEVVATDGKQLLVQGGFQFPWKDPALIPRVALFAAGMLPLNGSVKVGRSEKHVFVQAGGWTVALPVNPDGRYPRIEDIIPRPAWTTWSLSTTDAALLLRSLPKLPGAQEENSPITVDLRGQVAIRGWSSGQSSPAELELQQSKISGPPLRFSTNRQYLIRALQLGFREVHIVSADTPFLCQDAQRKYVWMPLPSAQAIRPCPDVIPIRPQQEASVTRRRKRSSREQPPVPRPVILPIPGPGPAPAPVSPRKSCVASLIEEAKVLKAALGGMFARSRQLVSALQAHRKEARVVDSTLKSLRKLQTQVKSSTEPRTNGTRE